MADLYLASHVSSSNSEMVANPDFKIPVLVSWGWELSKAVQVLPQTSKANLVLEKFPNLYVLTFFCKVL